MDRKLGALLSCLARSTRVWKAVVTRRSQISHLAGVGVKIWAHLVPHPAGAALTSQGAARMPAVTGDSRTLYSFQMSRNRNMNSGVQVVRNFTAVRSSPSTLQLATAWRLLYCNINCRITSARVPTVPQVSLASAALPNAHASCKTSGR